MLAIHIIRSVPIDRVTPAWFLQIFLGSTLIEIMLRWFGVYIQVINDTEKAYIVDFGTWTFRRVY